MLYFSTRSRSMLPSRMSDWDGKEEVLGSFGEGQRWRSLYIAKVAMGCQEWVHSCDGLKGLEVERSHYTGHDLLVDHHSHRPSEGDHVEREKFWKVSGIAAQPNIMQRTGMLKRDPSS